MSLALYVSAAWLALAWVVAILVGRTVRLRDEHERPRPDVPAFRFGSGPLAGVGLHTSRPWVQR